ncbi:MAG: RNA polymerase sigma factor [Bacillus sp. (in: Bacteria)]|nr:RNA polymerase sigma factor [Bacillus sp. (in: firmicutes)]
MDDKQLISEWFHQYSNDIYHFLLYRTGSPHAEDLVQEVFIKAMGAMDTFQGNASPKTWLLSIARNVAIDHFRSQKNRFWDKLIPFEKQHEPIQGETPDSVLQLNEENKKLYNSIKELKGKYRDVLILRGIQELTVKETGEILGWTENKVRMTYHRAKDALGKELEKNEPKQGLS